MALITIQQTDNVGLSRITINNNFQYLDDAISAIVSGISWQEAVLDIVRIPLVVGPVSGDRYIALLTESGYTKDNIYEWNGALWVETSVAKGFAVYVDDVSMLYIYNGTNWVELASVASHNSLTGLQGGGVTERYHLTALEHLKLTGNQNAQTIHYHDTETSVPATPDAAGIKGQWASAVIGGARYIYFCIAANSWVRYVTATDWPDEA